MSIYIPNDHWSEMTPDTNITPFSSPTFTGEINFEPYLKVKASKEEILIALREYYPEKFI